MINNIKFDIYDYDDEESIINRYALLVDDEALPEYFSLTRDDKISIEDVRDEIKNLEEDDLENVSEILLKYPNLKKSTIGILWIKNQNLKNVKIDGPLKKLDNRGIFSTLKRIEITLKDYQLDVKKERVKLKKNVDNLIDSFKKFDKLEKVDADQFILEEVFLNVKFSSDKNLIELFDEIDTSLNIPFVELHYKSKEYYKIYTLLTPSKEWIDKETIDTNDYIRFKLLNGNSNPFSVKHIEDIYSECVIVKGVENYELKFSFTISQNFNEEEAMERIFNMFGSRLKYEIMFKQQNGIRGIFKIENFDFNSALFADFLSTDPLISPIFFLDERIKSVLLKNKFYFYYDPKQLRYPTESMGISIKKDEKQRFTQIRIVRAKNVEKAEILRLILIRIFGLFKMERKNIEKIYLNIVSKDKIEKYQSKKIQKEQKTKQRLVQLMEIKPDLFRASEYAVQCQKPFQPYIVPEEDYKIISKKLNNPHKMMNYSNTWFACEPRDPSDRPEAQRNIWPGLKPNTKGSSDYQKEQPYLPCCFKADQFTKKGSVLQQQNKEENTKSGFGYIVGIKKMCAPGRKGEVPFLWEKILKLLDFEKIKLGSYAKIDKPIYPVLRVGVLHSPSSIIHCLELAFNSSYPTTEKKQIERIRIIRNELLDQNFNFTIAKQSFYAETDDMIKNILKDETQYIDPTKFIEILQKKYQCNIFMYEYSDKNPDGEIVLPVYSQAYLSKKLPKRNAVLILLYETKNKSYPYQCELLCEISIKNGKEDKKNIKYYFEPNSSISEMAIKLFNKHNEVFFVDANKYKMYKPINIS